MVQLSNVCFFRELRAAERSRELNASPLRMVQEIGRFINFRRHIQRGNALVRGHYQRIDLQIDEVEFSEQAQQRDDEHCEALLSLHRHLHQQGSSDLLDGARILNVQTETNTFAVNIPNIYTAFVTKQNLIFMTKTLQKKLIVVVHFVSYANLNANVILIGLSMWNEWLDDEMIQYTTHNLDLLFFVHAFFNPRNNLSPSQVDTN